MQRVERGGEKVNDVEFKVKTGRRRSWATDTLRVLSGFSHFISLDVWQGCRETLIKL